MITYTKEMFLNIQVYSIHCTMANQTKMAAGCSVGTHGNKGRQFRLALPLVKNFQVLLKGGY